MALYDKFADSPNRLKLEAQEITVKMVRNGDGTATIKWNIPNIAGCNVDDLIYDGIIITVSSKPANYITTSPQSGTYYEADPTFDTDMHSGDNINVALVVGAFYHDRETVSVTVSDVVDKTPYYVSAYAVDAQGNYFREGVHAYSIPTGQAETNVAGAATPAFHDIQIDTPEGITVKEPTGLNVGTNYKLTLYINGACYELTGLAGSKMQTYEDMAALLNIEMKKLVDSTKGVEFPNTGNYFVKVEDEEVYVWDGTQNVLQDAVFLDFDPSTPILGTYWNKPSTSVLKIRESFGWTTVSNIIEYATDPSVPSDGAVWLNKAFESSGDLDVSNTLAWSWEVSTWCKKPLFVQTRNPLLAPVLDSSTYWYDEVNGIVFNRDITLSTWSEVDPIVWDTNPNSIVDGNFWYNTELEKVFNRISSEWQEATNIRYEERNASGELDNPTANHYWFIPSEQLLFQRNSDNDAWTSINVIIAASDPTDRASCDLWWNVSTGIDTIFKWDAVNNEWDSVSDFFQSEIDPALPSTLESGALWYNPTTDVLQRITGINCTDVIPICSQYDPTNLPVGVVWKNTTSGEWYVWDGSTFTIIDVINSEIDPFDITDGIHWYDTNTDVLYLRDSGAWVEKDFSLTSLAPSVDEYFFNTFEDELYKWNGSAWLEDCGLAKVTLHFNRNVCTDDLPDVNTDLFSPFNDFDRFGRDILRFETCGIGCEQRIEFDRKGNGVFSYLRNSIIHFTPITGKSVNEAGPSYSELGVGDDGTPDERRALQDQIRIALGSVGTTVELTKQQLDECINNALLMVRKYSSYSYEHVLFFMDVFPNQQRYELVNKCVGFNKITNINACHRMRTGFLGASQGSFGGYDVYGYAALQQLYSGNSFDLLSYHLTSSYIEELRNIFADHLVYTFYEDTRILNFHQVFYNNERILLDAFIEVPEQRLITNRHLAMWIKKWAIAEAKMILSQVRGKFQTLPGPNGSTTLNSQELITQAENEKSELTIELQDRSMQDHNSDASSQILIG